MAEIVQPQKPARVNMARKRLADLARGRTAIEFDETQAGYLAYQYRDGTMTLKDLAKSINISGPRLAKFLKENAERIDELADRYQQNPAQPNKIETRPAGARSRVRRLTPEEVQQMTSIIASGKPASQIRDSLNALFQGITE